MSELSKERLLEILKDWFENFDWAFKEDKQAYQQLKELIQNQPEVDEGFIRNWGERIYCNRKSIRSINTNLRDMFQETGVKIKE